MQSKTEPALRLATSDAYYYWPVYLLVEAGPDLSLLVGLLLYKAELYTESIDHLKRLVDDAAYVGKRPALLYYLARAEYGDAIYDAAVRNMDRFLTAPPAPVPTPAPR